MNEHPGCSVEGDIMSANWKNRMPLAVGAALVVLALVITSRWQPARADKDAAASCCQRYSVLDTEGHNLIVTDNQTNTLYFYTIDKDKPIGSELKLRGTIDLSQVGKPIIKPMTTKTEP
jgi:hypothetical protein